MIGSSTLGGKMDGWVKVWTDRRMDGYIWPYMDGHMEITLVFYKTLMLWDRCPKRRPTDQPNDGPTKRGVESRCDVDRNDMRITSFIFSILPSFFLGSLHFFPLCLFYCISSFVLSFFLSFFLSLYLSFLFFLSFYSCIL